MWKTLVIKLISVIVVDRISTISQRNQSMHTIGDGEVNGSSKALCWDSCERQSCGSRGHNSTQWPRRRGL